MEVLDLANRSLTRTLIAFMKRAVSPTFVRRIPLVRLLERVRTVVYKLLVNVYHLLGEAILLLRSAADAVQLGPGDIPSKAQDVSLIDILKTFRSRCRMLKDSLPDAESAFDSGRADLDVELKFLDFHHVSRMLYLLPGSPDTHSAIITGSNKAACPQAEQLRIGPNSPITIKSSFPTRRAWENISKSESRSSTTTINTVYEPMTSSRRARSTCSAWQSNLKKNRLSPMHYSDAELNARDDGEGNWYYVKVTQHHDIIRGFPFDVSEKYGSAPTKRIGYDWRNQSGSGVLKVFWSKTNYPVTPFTIDKEGGEGKDDKGGENTRSVVSYPCLPRQMVPALLTGSSLIPVDPRFSTGVMLPTCCASSTSIGFTAQSSSVFFSSSYTDMPRRPSCASWSSPANPCAPL
ncbi:hypothetical protein EDD85DRAFT_983085 [Armillaria nabsnona]|nr:hypothetical protein EDD85DRAFT_983085 [Armillaria nabsnona]